MARGTPDNLFLDDAVVALVYNTKLPDLMGSMEGVRASDLDRFDSEVLRLEESIIRIAHHLRSYCRRLIHEWNFPVARGTYDALWLRLVADFQRFCDQCFRLGINVPNTRCLVLEDGEDDRFFQL